MFHTRKKLKGSISICFGTLPELDMTLVEQKDFFLKVKEAPRPKLKITIHWTSLIMILLMMSGIDI